MNERDELTPNELGWPGGQAPLWVDEPAAAMIPEYYRSKVHRQWGYPPAEGVPPLSWGIGHSSRQNDEFDRHADPAAAAEVVRWIDDQRCITVDPADIQTTGTAFELVRVTHIPAASGAVIERIPTNFPSIAALDGAGNPVFDYGNLNGQNTCLDGLVHPDPAIGSLTWRFHITLTHMPSVGAPVTPYLGPITPIGIPGDELLSPWSDMRNGHASRWADRKQFVIRPSTQIRYWVVLFGPPNRYQVSVGALLSGYWQLGGREGVALSSAIRRIV